MKLPRLALFALSALVVVGCGSSASKAAEEGKSPESKEAKTLAGFKQVDLPAFTMQLPEKWQVIDMAAKDLATQMESMGKSDPEMAKMLPVIKQMAASGQFKLFAFDVANTEDGFTDNVNVIVQDAQNIKLEEVAKANATQLKSAYTTVKGANSDLALIKWGQKAQVDLKYHTLLGTSAGHVFTFTFTCTAKHEAAYAKVVEQIIPTITLK